jgi:hypothetical protein
MPMDEAYRIGNEPRTALAGTRMPYTVQAWKKEYRIAAAAGTPSSAAPNVATPARQRIETALSRVITTEPPATESGKKTYSFEQALAETTQDDLDSLAALSPASGGDPAQDGPNFGDVIDVINPLQHIPLVNLAYRSISGDTIGAIGQIIGGALYGGPIGAVSGTVNAIVQETTGKDIAGNVLGIVTDSFN